MKGWICEAYEKVLSLDMGLWSLAQRQWRLVKTAGMGKKVQACSLRRVFWMTESGAWRWVQRRECGGLWAGDLAGTQE